MNLSTILNIAIGSIFIFLILSLLAAEIQELITTLLQWRAVHLKRSIEILLTGGEPTPNDEKVQEIVKELYNNPLIKNINQGAKKGAEANLRKLTNLVTLNLGLTDLGEEEGKKRGTAPSYIPAETFATTLLVKLKIPNLVHQLSSYNLKKVVNDELLTEIENTVNVLKPNDDIKTLLTPLETRVKKIINNFQLNKITLPNCIAQIRSAVDEYVKKFNKQFDDDSTKDKFSNEIDLIKKDVFGLDDNHKELLQRLQPNLTQVIELLNKKSNISQAFFNELKNVAGNESDPVYKAYKELEKDLNKLIADLPPKVQESLNALAVRTQMKAKSVEEELNQFRQEIENWFDRSMDRATGVYKRNAKGVAFFLGFAIAAIANADTLHIFSRLSNDNALQQIVVNSASQAVTQGNDLSVIKNQANRALTDVALPIGWTPANVCQQSGYELNPLKNNQTVSVFEPLELNNICKSFTNSQTPATQTQSIPTGDRRLIFTLNRLFGWLLSALAISMGAPFWFELLGKFINVRNTGKRPASPIDTQANSGNQASPPQS